MICIINSLGINYEILSYASPPGLLTSPFHWGKKLYRLVLAYLDQISNKDTIHTPQLLPCHLVPHHCTWVIDGWFSLATWWGMSFIIAGGLKKPWTQCMKGEDFNLCLIFYSFNHFLFTEH